MNTQKTSSEQNNEKTSSGSWPIKLNKALIAVGVIAFGLIVTDRLLEAFKADDAPAVASIDGTATNDTNEIAENELSSVVADIEPDGRESLSELQNLIGSRVVFVSATKPGYLVTEDERRIAVGEAIAEETTLAEVTTHQLILNRSGELKVVNLTDPVVQ